MEHMMRTMEKGESMKNTPNDKNDETHGEMDEKNMENR